VAIKGSAEQATPDRHLLTVCLREPEDACGEEES
jgi:hypothetical protein